MNSGHSWIHWHTRGITYHSKEKYYNEIQTGRRCDISSSHCERISQYKKNVNLNKGQKFWVLLLTLLFLDREPWSSLLIPVIQSQVTTSLK
jgi:hypothetical protein